MIKIDLVCLDAVYIIVGLAGQSGGHQLISLVNDVVEAGKLEPTGTETTWIPEMEVAAAVTGSGSQRSETRDTATRGHCCSSRSHCRHSCCLCNGDKSELQFRIVPAV